MNKGLMIGIGIIVVLGIVIIAGFSDFDGSDNVNSTNSTEIDAGNDSGGTTYYATLDESVGVEDSSP